jgi:acyl-coenzyme A synthetase/AMP-(fatty) acid ligase
MSAETFNACVYLVDRQVEAGNGDRLAVTGPAGSLTYAELAARAAELAAGFGACGVRPEERVLLVATDGPETVITFCALLRMGAVPAPVSKPGHLLVRGDSIATGYWCRTATSREVFQGEWLRTGDTYTRSADGFYTCLGRSNDMIKASGIWVSPMEVEGRLLAHPSVAECAVVGHRNPAGLEEVVACVVAAPGQSVDADGLIAFCREGLASFKRPRQVLALDALPKTATGKIQRVVVREVVAQRLAKPGE